MGIVSDFCDYLKCVIYRKLLYINVWIKLYCSSYKVKEIFFIIVLYYVNCLVYRIYIRY